MTEGKRDGEEERREVITSLERGQSQVGPSPVQSTEAALSLSRPPR